MIAAEGSIDINRPADDVFAYVSDQSNSPLWQPGLLEVRRTTEGPIGVGTRHTFVRTFMGRRMEASNEYTRYEPNTVVAFEFTGGGMAGQGSYVVEQAGVGRTTLTSRVELRPSGLLRLAEPLMRASLRRDMKATLGKLKSLLEEDVPFVAGSWDSA